MESIIKSFDNLVAHAKANQFQVIAGASVVAALIASYSFFGSSSNESNLAPAITQEEAKKLMSDILDKLHLAVPKLLRAGESIKQQITAQGQEVDDAQIAKAFLLPHLETQLREIQDLVLNEFDADEDELEEAVDYYIAAGDQDLLKISRTIQSIFQKFGYDIDVNDNQASSSSASNGSSGGSSQEVTYDVLIEILTALSTSLAEKTEEFISHYFETYGPPVTQDASSKFNTGLMYTSQT